MRKEQEKVFSDVARLRLFNEIVRTLYPAYRTTPMGDGSEWTVIPSNTDDPLGSATCTDADQFLTERLNGKSIKRGLPWSRAVVMGSRTLDAGTKGNFAPSVDEMLAWEQQHTVSKAAFLSPPGFGKSSALLDLLLTPARDMIRIACFHTRDRRDEFHADLKAEMARRKRRGQPLDAIGTFAVVYGQEELALQRLTARSLQRNAELTSLINKVLSPADDQEYSPKFAKLIDAMRDESVLTATEAGAIKRAWYRQAELLRSLAGSQELGHEPRTLIMCTAKMKSMAGLLSKLGPRVAIYQDEVEIGELTDLSGGVRDGYTGKTVTVPTPWDVNTLKPLRICYLTCELTIVRELGRIYGQSGYAQIGAGQLDTLFEPGLTVMLTDKSRIDDRPTLVAELKRQGYYVIGDGQDAGADTNSARAKGRNDLSNEKRIAVIASMPDGPTIGKICSACGVSEPEAIAIWVSDKANQGIGRNLGFRKKHPDAECFVVIPIETSNKHRFWEFLRLGFVPGRVAMLKDEEKPRDSAEPGLVASTPAVRIGDVVPFGIDKRTQLKEWAVAGFDVETETRWPRINGRKVRQYVVTKVMPLA
jgi:hypothetical protein